MIKRTILFTILVSIAVASSCGGSSSQTLSPPSQNATWPLSDAQVQHVLSEKVFFGHQSVGGNIVQGIHDLMGSDSRLLLNMVSSSNPASIAAPAFIDALIGANGDTASKDAAFTTIVDNGYGSQGGIAMYKYCYVDIDDNSNVQQLLQNYTGTINALKARYPSLTVIPVTAPLMTGPSTGRDKFNTLLRTAFANTPIFDLAAAESTHADGSRSSTTVGGVTVYTLASEYTNDGGHLNTVGRQAVAKQLLITLAGL